MLYFFFEIIFACEYIQFINLFFKTAFDYFFIFYIVTTTTFFISVLLLLFYFILFQNIQFKVSTYLFIIV